MKSISNVAYTYIGTVSDVGDSYTIMSNTHGYSVRDGAEFMKKLMGLLVYFYLQKINTNQYETSGDGNMNNHGQHNQA